MEAVTLGACVLCLAVAAVLLLKARRTYEALSDYPTVKDLGSRLEALERDRDSSRNQLDHSGEHALASWPFDVPANVHPRLVDYSEPEKGRTS